jgi:isocitrate lyase
MTTDKVTLPSDLSEGWTENSRWKNVTRPYSVDDVTKLRGSFVPEYTVARNGAERLWRVLNESDYVHALGAMTGG